MYRLTQEVVIEIGAALAAVNTEFNEPATETAYITGLYDLTALICYTILVIDRENDKVDEAYADHVDQNRQWNQGIHNQC